MMSTLPAFLTSIGAGELSSQLILPANGSSKGPFALLHDRLQAEIDSIAVSPGLASKALSALGCV